MTLETQTSMVVDRSAHGELLRINFNISFPSLSCEFATLDVSDALGTVRFCVTLVTAEGYSGGQSIVVILMCASYRNV